MEYNLTRINTILVDTVGTDEFCEESSELKECDRYERTCVDSTESAGTSVIHRHNHNKKGHWVYLSHDAYPPQPWNTHPPPGIPTPPHDTCPLWHTHPWHTNPSIGYLPSTNPPPASPHPTDILPLPSRDLGPEISTPLAGTCTHTY